MDGQHMDHIARSLASGMSRRGVMKATLAGAAGGVVVLLGDRTAEAAKCQAGEERCGGAGCYPTDRCSCIKMGEGPGPLYRPMSDASS